MNKFEYLSRWKVKNVYSKFLLTDFAFHRLPRIVTPASNSINEYYCTNGWIHKNNDCKNMKKNHADLDSVQ